MEVERVILGRSFMCAPIGGRVGLSARTPREGGHCSNAGSPRQAGSVRYDEINYTAIGEFAYWPSVRASMWGSRFGHIACGFALNLLAPRSSVGRAA